MVTKTSNLIKRMKTPVQKAEKKTTIATEMFLPNNSGDHKKGLKIDEPKNNYDLVNKKYVDDNDYWIGDASEINPVNNQSVQIRNTSAQLVHELNNDGSAVFNTNTDAVIITFNGDEVSDLLKIDGVNEEVLVSDKLELDIVNNQFISSFGSNKFDNEIGIGITPENNLGIKMAGFSDESIEIYQGGDSKGISFYGYDDQSASNFQFHITSSGRGRLYASTKDLQLQTATAGKKVWVASAGDFRVDLGDNAGSYSLELRDSGLNVVATINSNGTADIDEFKINSTTLINSSGFITPITSTDAAAPNNSIYYSSTKSKLVYKDSGGGINNLY